MLRGGDFDREGLGFVVDLRCQNFDLPAALLPVYFLLEVLLPLIVGLNFLGAHLLEGSA